MIAGLYDARELADILDLRASTIRKLVETKSPLIPAPVYILGEGPPFWLMKVIECWGKQGYPANFEYDREEFGELALEDFIDANREAIDAHNERVTQ